MHGSMCKHACTKMEGNSFGMRDSLTALCKTSHYDWMCNHNEVSRAWINHYLGYVPWNQNYTRLVVLLLCWRTMCWFVLFSPIDAVNKTIVLQLEHCRFWMRAFSQQWLHRATPRLLNHTRGFSEKTCLLLATSRFSVSNNRYSAVTRHEMEESNKLSCVSGGLSLQMERGFKLNRLQVETVAFLECTFRL